MKLAWLFGLAGAVLFYGGVILFSILFLDGKKKDEGTLQTVDLLSSVDAEKDKDKKKPEAPEEKKQEDIETQAEQPPDAAEMLRNLDVAPVDNTPALDAASLSAIEAALGGQSGGGDFAEALSFSSGGRIGGTGVANGSDQKIEEAFSLSEIDQKPRAVFQESPVYPSEVRGKKIEGLVTLVFVVDATGKVESSRVEKSSQAVFETPAQNALKKWKFEPGVRAGQRVASKMRVSIRFPPS